MKTSPFFVRGPQWVYETSRKYYWFSLASSILVVIGSLFFPNTPGQALAYLFPTATITPTSTSTPQPTQAAVPLATATLPITNTPYPTLRVSPLDTIGPPDFFAWPIVLTDDFASDQGLWITESFEDELVAIEKEIQQGEFQWMMTAKQGVIWRDTPDLAGLTFTDFFVSVDAWQIEGSENSTYGIVFRADQENYYFFGVSNIYFRLDLFLDGQWHTLIDWNHAPALSIDQSNRLEIAAEGSHFTFFANGEQIAEWDDDSLSTGTVGVAAALFNPEDQATFAFDNFEVRAPDFMEDTAVVTIPVTASPTASNSPTVTPTASDTPALTPTETQPVYTPAPPEPTAKPTKPPEPDDDEPTKPPKPSDDEPTKTPVDP